MIGSFFALFETKWRILGILGTLIAAVSLLGQVFLIWKERAQTFRGPKEINAYMMRWLESGGKTAIFTNDMTWAEDQEVFDVLEAKAQRNELLVCASADNGRISKLASAGADASRPLPDSGPADTGPADTGPADTGPSTFALGGTATVAANTGTAGVGADGTGGLVLTNGVEDVTVLASGPFRFPTPVARGSAYAVTVKSAPTNPAQTCQVTAGTGTVSGAVDTVRVVCTAVPHKITGTLKGKRAPKLTLTSGRGSPSMCSPMGPLNSPVPSEAGPTSPSLSAQRRALRNASSTAVPRA